MKIIVENKIPYINGVLEPAGEVVYLAPEEITAEAVKDADALFIRTRTRCDSNLLEGSRCHFIATATIGTDHIDLDYCRAHDITVANAPGCNAPAVAQYVMSAIINRYGPFLDGLRLGVVGVGHVGSIVSAWGHSLGLDIMECDPPRAEKEVGNHFASLNDIAAGCDIITFHTPLTREGAYPTFHLADEKFFNSLERKPFVINSARGSIMDTPAAIRAFDDGKVSHLVIDCWEGEPNISLPLLEKAFIATPHIAGYSREGKIRATAMTVEAFSRHFGVKVNPLSVELPGPVKQSVTTAEILQTTNILNDSALLKMYPDRFESLRNEYHLRPEP
ncbi:MAG: 4-phosphoerythronate dehydrogenase [Lachnoclostridium sp.]|nr:4-phosphoerythronate dehydrogenase [Lachnoclostridium sp.]